MKRRGFALFLSLVMVVVVSLMTWTFMEFGLRNRVDSLRGEGEIRALHAAEAGVRYYLAGGPARSFEMNDCHVNMQVAENSLECSAFNAKASVTITLLIQDGVVVERRER